MATRSWVDLPPRIDLRSDTFTLPSEAMREAMVSAPLGDDVFGEDPTVNRLQALAAEITGKEAALFVSSGTQGNLVSLLSHCGRGDEVILGDQAHIFYYEQGGSAALGGIHPRLVPTQADGSLRLEDIATAIRGNDSHFPISRLICLENTHNRAGGTFQSPDYVSVVADLARSHGLAIHIDGARIFNAAVAQNVAVRELVKDADSVTFCLSKGLSAPVGSIVCGSKEFIARAHRNRKILGGGMRQAGIIAAAGIVALTEMVERLADDHANARRLAEGMDALPGISVDLSLVQTNIFYFDFDHPRLSTGEFLNTLHSHGVGMLDTAPQRIRAVTHYGIEAEDIEEALRIVEEVVG